MNLSTLIAAANGRIRRYVKAMPPDQRSALFEQLPARPTHLYAWLRGEKHQIALPALDAICRRLGINLQFQDATPNGRIRKVKVVRRPRKRVNWRKADWSKPVAQIARDLQCAPSTAYAYALTHNIPIQRHKQGRPRKAVSL
jgi:hypothetical protein